MDSSVKRFRLSRRAFLGGAGSLAALPALAGPSGRLNFRVLPTDPAPEPDRKVSTFCELCFWNCGVIAKARKNRVLSLEGHPGYPNAMGRLCGRGNAGAAFLRDNDRLQYPMVRIGERGEGKFKRVGWKTALQLVAQGFAQIKEKYGSQAAAIYYHGSGGAFFRKLMVAYGTPNYCAPSYAQCKGARDVGYFLTFGEKLGNPEPLDFEATKCMIFFGSHLGENAHNSQVQAYVRARARGAKLIVLDPRMSTPAGRADVWLPLRPGSDLAVILAWIHLAIKENAYDHEFVRKFTTGFEALAEHVKECTPGWAAREAGVDETAIVEAWRLIKEAGSAVLIHPGRHVSWYGEADTQRARAQAILTAILGAFWSPGGLYRPERPNVPAFPSPKTPPLPKDVDKAAGRFPFAQETTTNGIRDATITGKPYPIKGWFVYASNVVQALPNMPETIEAIKQLDLLVVCDVQPTDITRFADIILPEDLYLERYDDLALGGGRQPYIGIRQPVVESPYDTRPAWRIARDLAREMGLGDQFAFESFEDYLETRLAPTGIKLADLKRDGIREVPRKTAPYLDRVEGYEFQTPSKKVELYSAQMKEKGFDPLPVYKPQPDPPPGTFRLLYGRSPLQTFSRTQNNPILFDLEPTNDLWMATQDAAALGLSHGQKVMLKSGKGVLTGPLPLHVTERMPQGCVYTTHGFGQRSKGLKRTFGMGGSDTEMIETYALDPISGTTGMRTSFVTVE